jgi:hypothetical protein
MNVNKLVEHDQVKETTKVKFIFKKIKSFSIADIYSTMVRTPSPFHRVDFFLDDVENSKLSSSPGSPIGDIIECSEQDKVKTSNEGTSRGTKKLFSLNFVYK